MDVESSDRVVLASLVAQVSGVMFYDIAVSGARAFLRGHLLNYVTTPINLIYIRIYVYARVEALAKQVFCRHFFLQRVSSLQKKLFCTFL